MSILKVRSFVIVTGASRGIGRAIAVQLAGKIHSDSVMVLTARSMQALEETAGIIKRDVDGKMNVRCISADLSDEESVARLIKDVFDDMGDVSRFDHAILVHNAASLESIDKFARELSDVKAMQKYCLTNLTSTFALTSAFFKNLENAKASLRRTIVQVTSLAGTYAQKTMHLYGMAKAGRDLFFRVMALEEPEVRVLTFDPGTVNTDMYSEVNKSKDSELCGMAEHFAAQSTFLSPEQSADTLIKALEEDKYQSGAKVSTYEVLKMDVSEMTRFLIR